MQIEAAAQPLPQRAWRKTALSAAVLIAACALALGIGLAHTALALRLQAAWPAANNGLLWNLQFSLPLLAAGVLVIIWKPRAFGFQVGDMFTRWKLVLLLVVGISLFTVLALMLVGPTPYSGADWLFEVLWVPLSEETMFRGVMYTLIAWVLSKLYSGSRLTLLTVLFSGIAFGIAHSGNIAYNPPLFTALQVIFATISGILMGYSRARTGSIYPAMLMHAAFNTVAVLM